MFRVARGRSYARQHAAIHESFIGRGLPLRPGIGTDPTPRSRNRLVGVEDDDTVEPALQPVTIPRAPVTDLGPLPQLAKRHGDAPRGTSQLHDQGTGKSVLDALRRDIGIENDVIHQLGEIRPAVGVGIGDELLELLIGVEDTLLRHVADRRDRAHALAADSSSTDTRGRRRGTRGVPPALSAVIGTSFVPVSSVAPQTHGKRTSVGRLCRIRAEACPNRDLEGRSVAGQAHAERASRAPSKAPQCGFDPHRGHVQHPHKKPADCWVGYGSSEAPLARFLGYAASWSVPVA
jgi:hypothetical protein